MSAVDDRPDLLAIAGLGEGVVHRWADLDWEVTDNLKDTALTVIDPNITTITVRPPFSGSGSGSGDEAEQSLASGERPDTESLVDRSGRDSRPVQREVHVTIVVPTTIVVHAFSTPYIFHPSRRHAFQNQLLPRADRRRVCCAGASQTHVFHRDDLGHGHGMYGPAPGPSCGRGPAVHLPIR